MNLKLNSNKIPQNYIEFKTYKVTSYIMKTSHVAYSYLNYYKKLILINDLRYNIKNIYACANRHEWNYTFSGSFSMITMISFSFK